MVRTNCSAGRDGTLILVSGDLDQLGRFEKTTRNWNVVSILLDASDPSSLVSALSCHGNVVIAALGANATAFALGLPPDVLRKVAGMLLVGGTLEQLEGLAPVEYPGDVVLVNAETGTLTDLAMLRRRMPGFRLVDAKRADEVEHALDALMGRCHSHSSSIAAPIKGISPIHRNATPADKRDLPPLARRIFVETFGHLFEPKALSGFCDVAYGRNGTMAADIEDADIKWRIVEFAGEPIAYAKVRPLVAPAPNPKPGAMELQQIYVASEWHGTGVSEELMLWAIDTARQQGARELYLTVFDHNERAKSFYRKHGFREVGRCVFTLGGRNYDDRIWSKSLCASDPM